MHVNFSNSPSSDIYFASGSNFVMFVPLGQYVLFLTCSTYCGFFDVKTNTFLPDKKICGDEQLKSLLRRVEIKMLK